MIYKINTDNFELSQKAEEYLEKQVKKVERFLSNYTSDLPLLQLSVKHHLKRRVFEGSMVLHLPEQPLSAHFRAASFNEAIKTGFSKVVRELRELKEKRQIYD